MWLLPVRSTDERCCAAIGNASMLEGIRKAADAGKSIAIVPAKGDVSAINKGDAKAIKAEYLSQLLAHATLEPQNFTADYKNGKYLLIGSTQF